MKLLKKIINLGSKLLGSGSKKSSNEKTGGKADKNSKERRFGFSQRPDSVQRGERVKQGKGKFSNSSSTRGDGERSSSKDSSQRRERGEGERSGASRGEGRTSGRTSSRSGEAGRSHSSERGGERGASRGGRSFERGGRGRGGKDSRVDLNDPFFASIKVREPKTDKELPEAKSLQDLQASIPEFAELGLNEKVLSSVADMGYSAPTPIQKQSIPAVLAGSDIIGTAQTGTGKTAAFSLPIIQKLDADKENCFGKPVVLVLSPTRELTTQTAEAFKNFSKYVDIQIALIQGGVSMRPQIVSLMRGAEVVIATPGRLLDLIHQRILSLKDVKYLVLDEVDRMFDMGFIEDVSNIIRYCSKERQTLFFSATMPDAVMRLSEWALKDPVRLENGIACSPADTIEHFVYPVDGIQKYDLLIELLKSITFQSLIVFTRTRMDADRISEWLIGHDYKVSTLHSDRTQFERDKALKNFKDGETSILVATDIASRGLDISNVSHVINYNVPEHSEDYVHRIGRTGRANKDGTAVTLFASEETEFLRRIEALINSPIERRKLEGFAYRNEPILNDEPKRQRRRNR